MDESHYTQVVKRPFALKSDETTEVINGFHHSDLDKINILLVREDSVASIPEDDSDSDSRFDADQTRFSAWEDAVLAESRLRHGSTDYEEGFLYGSDHGEFDEERSNLDLSGRALENSNHLYIESTSEAAEAHISLSINQEIRSLIHDRVCLQAEKEDLMNHIEILQRKRAQLEVVVGGETDSRLEIERLQRENEILKSAQERLGIEINLLQETSISDPLTSPTAFHVMHVDHKSISMENTRLKAELVKMENQLKDANDRIHSLQLTCAKLKEQSPSSERKIIHPQISNVLSYDSESKEFLTQMGLLFQTIQEETLLQIDSLRAQMSTGFDFDFNTEELQASMQYALKNTIVALENIQLKCLKWSNNCQEMGHSKIHRVSSLKSSLSSKSSSSTNAVVSSTSNFFKTSSPISNHTSDAVLVNRASLGIQTEEVLTHREQMQDLANILIPRLRSIISMASSLSDELPKEMQHALSAVDDMIQFYDSHSTFHRIEQNGWYGPDQDQLSPPLVRNGSSQNLDEYSSSATLDEEFELSHKQTLDSKDMLLPYGHSTSGSTQIQSSQSNRFCKPMELVDGAQYVWGRWHALMHDLIDSMPSSPAIDTFTQDLSELVEIIHQSYAEGSYAASDHNEPPTGQATGIPEEIANELIMASEYLALYLLEANHQADQKVKLTHDLLKKVIATLQVPHLHTNMDQNVKVLEDALSGAVEMYHSTLTDLSSLRIHMENRFIQLQQENDTLQYQNEEMRERDQVLCSYLTEFEDICCCLIELWSAPFVNSVALFQETGKKPRKLESYDINIQKDTFLHTIVAVIQESRGAVRELRQDDSLRFVCVDLFKQFEELKNMALTDQEQLQSLRIANEGYQLEMERLMRDNELLSEQMRDQQELLSGNQQAHIVIEDRGVLELIKVEKDSILRELDRISTDYRALEVNQALFKADYKMVMDQLKNIRDQWSEYNKNLAMVLPRLVTGQLDYEEVQLLMNPPTSKPPYKRLDYVCDGTSDVFLAMVELSRSYQSLASLKDSLAQEGIVMRQEMHVLSQARETLQSVVQEISSDVEKWKADISTTHQRYEDSRKDAELLRVKLMEKQDDFQSLERHNVSLQRRIDELEKQLHRSTSELNDVVGQSKQWSMYMANANADVEALKIQLEKSNAENARISQELRKAQDLYSSIRDIQTDINQTIVTSMRPQTATNEKVRQLQSQVEYLKLQNQDLQNRLVSVLDKRRTSDWAPVSTSKYTNDHHSAAPEHADPPNHRHTANEAVLYQRGVPDGRALMMEDDAHATYNLTREELGRDHSTAIRPRENVPSLYRDEGLHPEGMQSHSRQSMPPHQLDTANDDDPPFDEYFQTHTSAVNHRRPPTLSTPNTYDDGTAHHRPSTAASAVGIQERAALQRGSTNQSQGTLGANAQLQALRDRLQMLTERNVR
eukprot:TRINITY_DN234_c0_g2_i1.p1 TRINITY_DN234_c0_g2~~TRINITY_DN234_c0_g2_i1.p1  ORF type:complete len:1424 (-),score=289.51 TRINITY_DN234_c0_g2_i1:295-4566(-)